MGLDKVRRRLSARNSRMELPTTGAPLTQANLGVQEGNVMVGFSAGTFQLGINVNGTAYILRGTPGGALTIGTAL